MRSVSVVFPLSMWAEMPMFRSFEKSVYTSYLHLRGGPTNMGESMRGAARPAVRRASMDAARVEPVARRLNFSQRGDGYGSAPFTHLDGVARAQPRTTDGVTQPGAQWEEVRLESFAGGSRDAVRRAVALAVIRSSSSGPVAHAPTLVGAPRQQSRQRHSLGFELRAAIRSNAAPAALFSGPSFVW